MHACVATQPLRTGQRVVLSYPGGRIDRSRVEPDDEGPTVGRHRTPEEKRELGEQARAMRAAGRSRREIIRELHVGEDLLGALLRGTELPDRLRRPQAKDDVRARAVALREAGRTYDEIAAELGVSKSSCSLWLRDLPRPEGDPARRAAAEARRLEALRTRMTRNREDRERQGEDVVSIVASAVGEVSSRDLLVALAISYWCEGAKSKPWNKSELIQWMNSDPMLVGLFLDGLRELGVTHDRLRLRLHIHEAADEEGCRRWWSAQTGVSLERFARSTIKRHNPKTVRHNVGDDYRGCLCVTVYRSRTLYLAMEGIVRGLSSAAVPPQVAA